MKEFQYTIQDAQGIHARPAGLLVKEASKFQSAITLEYNGKTGDAKRIFAVMALGVSQNGLLTVKADGTDEDDAIAALAQFFKANL